MFNALGWPHPHGLQVGLDMTTGRRGRTFLCSFAVGDLYDNVNGLCPRCRLHRVSNIIARDDPYLVTLLG